MTTPTNRGFQPGNQAAVGHSSRSQKLRHAILQAVTETDAQVVTARLIDMARKGSLPAIKLLFDTIGRPTEAVVTASPVASSGEPLNSERIREIAERVRYQRQTDASNQPAA